MSDTASFPSVTPYTGRELATNRGEIVAVYDYADAAGVLLFQVVRFRPKGFRTRRPNGQGGWIYGLAGIQPQLYRLPRVVAADVVLIVEGEKDVETAERLALPDGWAVTTSPFGACQWRHRYSRVLAGKRVYICPDTDKAGHDHVMQLGLSLYGWAREIRIVALPRTVKDLTEWIDDGADAEAFNILLRDAEPFGFPIDDTERMQNVHPLNDALALLCRLRGAVFEAGVLDTTGQSAAAEIGFLTEEVASLLPGWISTDGAGAPAVCVRGFEALATAGINELAADMRAVRALQREASARLARLEADGRPETASTPVTEAT
jgi:hypothetical protein